MKLLRHAVIPMFTAGLLCCMASVQAQQPQAQFDLLMRQALTSAAGKDLTVTRLEVEPGYSANSHSHPGETFVFVLSGRILNQVDDQEPQFYEAGDFFFEPANSRHAQFVNQDPVSNAVVLIVGIRPTGEN